MKFLIVESDPTTSSLLQTYLPDHGDCSIVVNGSEVIEKVRHAISEDMHYDLICLDLMISEVDGHDTLKEIRQIEKENNLSKNNCAKIIVTTVLSDFNNIANAFRAGCQAYLIKPVRKDELLEEMQKLGLLNCSV